MSERPGVTVAVTDHAVERFRQRVGTRTGAVDPRVEIASRVGRAWAADRVASEAPSTGSAGGARASGPRGSVYVRDVVDRDLLFVCRHDPGGGELVVISLWDTGRIAPQRVPKRFTDALRDS